MELVKLNFDPNLVPINQDADAEAEKITALAELKEVTQVTNPGEQDKAIRRARKAKVLIQEAEKSRRTILKPFEGLVDRINRVAKDYKQVLDTEINRVNILCRQFQDEEDRRLAAEEAARQAESARLRAEAEAADRRLREAEAEAEKARQEAEKARQEAPSGKADESPSEEGSKPHNREAEAFAELQRQEAIEARERAEAELRAHAEKPLAERQRSVGQLVREDVLYEVEDIEKVYRARPDLVRLELDRAKLRAILTKNLKVPGLRIWTEKRSGVRA